MRRKNRTRTILEAAEGFEQISKELQYLGEANGRGCTSAPMTVMPEHPMLEPWPRLKADTVEDDRNRKHGAAGARRNTGH